MLSIPEGWACLKPGDAAVTRVLKTLGPSWTATHQKGRRTYSDGVWAPKENIEKARSIVDEKRADPAYAKKRASALKQRNKKQATYETEFQEAILQWLNFHPRHKALANDMAQQIAAHATPIGSGTVARTERIPIEKRASAATIAWLRHKTTAYDSMKIARVKGRRRDVRRELARESVQLLKAYRDGYEIDPTTCPIAQALK